MNIDDFLKDFTQNKFDSLINDAIDKGINERVNNAIDGNYTCPCGQSVNVKNRKRHEKTKKHREECVYE